MEIIRFIKVYVYQTFEFWKYRYLDIMKYLVERIGNLAAKYQKSSINR